MSLAVWLGEDRKCSAAVVGLDLLLGLSIPGRKEGICSKSVRNVGTSSAVFSTTERTTRKLRIGRIRREFSCN